MGWIVYKGSGGLAHMLGGLSDAIKIAKKTNRQLVIDCQSAGAFQSRFDEYFYIDDDALSYSCTFAQLPDSAVYQGKPVGDFEDVPVIWSEGDRYFLGDEDITIVPDYLGRPMAAEKQGEIVFCGGPGAGIFGQPTGLFNRLKSIARAAKGVDSNKWNRDLMLQSAFKEQIERDFRIEGEFIGLHFRNTDIGNDVSAYLPRLRAAIRKHSIHRLVLATDDHRARSDFASALPDIDVLQLTSPGEFGGKNIHYHTEDKSQQIYECLLDIYMLLNSTVLIPSMNSGLSRWVVEMAEEGRNLFGFETEIREILV